MKYVTLLGLVATIASGYPLENLSCIEEFKIAEMAADIFVEQQGDNLVFKKISGKKSDITPELLASDFLYAPYIVFSCSHGRWFAEQTDSLDYFKRMLKFKKNEDSCKYAIIGADRISLTADLVDVKFDNHSNTLLVELV